VSSRPAPAAGVGRVGVWACAAALGAACGVPDGAPSGLPEELPLWDAGAPTLEIGAVEGDERYTFAAIESAVPLGGGTIAVSDAGHTRISLYGRDGRHIRSWGSQGEGPTEFRALSRIYPIGADTLLAAERYGGRVAVYDTGGSLVREVSAPELSGDTTFALDSWLHGRFWVEGALSEHERVAVRRALDALPPPRAAPGYRVVRAASDGDLLVREPSSDAAARIVTWTRLAPDGSPLSMVTTPAAFRPTHMDGDELLGVWTGENDVEFVRAYTLTATGTSRPLPAWIVGDARDTGMVDAEDPAEIRSLIVGSIKGLASAQEIHYSSAYTYTTSLDELERFEKPEGLEVAFVRGDARGWSAVFTHPGLDTVCGLAYGFGAPPGWTPGLVVCAPSPPSGGGP